MRLTAFIIVTLTTGYVYLWRNGLLGFVALPRAQQKPPPVKASAGK